MTKSEIFKAAHKLAKSVVAIVGDYMVAFSYSLKEVYKDMKSVDYRTVCENLGGKYWEKGDNKRVYFNDCVESFSLDFGSKNKNFKARMHTVYFCLNSNTIFCDKSKLSLEIIEAAKKVIFN